MSWPSIYNHTVLDNGDVMYYGRCFMRPNSVTPHIRVAEFRVPALIGSVSSPAPDQHGPVINATVYTLNRNAGTMFAISNISHGIVNSSESQFVVTANNTVAGQPCEMDFYCSITIIGTPDPNPPQMNP